MSELPPELPKSALYAGKVTHQRHRPKGHKLQYNVFSLFVELDELPALSQRLKLFSHNRRGFYALWDKDFGPGEGSCLKDYVQATLRRTGVDCEGGKVFLLCYPRMWGYVFNPLSVYYCYDRDNRLKALLYEVSNTFGQRHTYVIPVAADQDSVIEQQCQKEFYVSPFLEMDCTYHFRLRPPGQALSLTIHQEDGEGALLDAMFVGQQHPLTDKTLALMTLKNPLMSLKVIAGIHWEAFKIWRKKIALVPRPAAPAEAQTIVSTNTIVPPSSKKLEKVL